MAGGDPSSFDLAQARVLTDYLATRHYRSPLFPPSIITDFQGLLPPVGESAATFPAALNERYAGLVQELQRSAYGPQVQHLIGQDGAEALQRNAQRFAPPPATPRQLEKYWARGNVQEAIDNFLRERENSRYQQLYDAMLAVDARTEVPATPPEVSPREAFLSAVQGEISSQGQRRRRRGDFDFSGPLDRLGDVVDEFRLSLYAYLQARGLVDITPTVPLEPHHPNPLDTLLNKYRSSPEGADPFILPLDVTHGYDLGSGENSRWDTYRLYLARAGLNPLNRGRPLDPTEIPFVMGLGAYGLGIGRTMNFAGFPVEGMGRSPILGDTHADLVGRNSLLRTGGNVARLGETLYDADGRPFRAPIPINEAGELGVNPRHPYFEVDSIVGRQVLFVTTPTSSLETLLSEEFLSRVAENAILVFPQKGLLDNPNPDGPPMLLSDWVTERLERLGRRDLIPNVVHIRGLNFAKDLAREGTHVRLTLDAWENIEAARVVAHLLTGASGEDSFSSAHRTVIVGTNPRAADYMGWAKNTAAVYFGDWIASQYIRIATRESDQTMGDVLREFHARRSRFEETLLARGRALGILGAEESLPHGGLEDLRSCTEATPQLFTLIQQLFDLTGRGFLRALHQFSANVATVANSRNLQYGILMAVGEALVREGKIARVEEILPPWGLTAEGATSADKAIAFFEHPDRGTEAPSEFRVVPERMEAVGRTPSNLKVDAYGYPLQYLYATHEGLSLLADRINNYLYRLGKPSTEMDRTPQGIRQEAMVVLDEVLKILSYVITTHETAESMRSTLPRQEARDRSLASTRTLQTRLETLRDNLRTAETPHPEYMAQTLYEISEVLNEALPLFQLGTDHPTRRGVHRSLLGRLDALTQTGRNVWVEGIADSPHLGGPLQHRMHEPIDTMILGVHMSRLAQEGPEAPLWNRAWDLTQERLGPEVDLMDLSVVLHATSHRAVVSRAYGEIASFEASLPPERPLTTGEVALLMWRQTHYQQEGAGEAPMTTRAFVDGPGRLADRDPSHLRGGRVRRLREVRSVREGQWVATESRGRTRGRRDSESGPHRGPGRR